MTISESIDRGIQQVYPDTTLSAELAGIARPQRIKMGFDPTRPDLHIGHYVGLRKLRLLQERGHRIIIIIGDYTARIGDPSGRDATRPSLSTEEIENNTLTYLDQLYTVLDEVKTQVRYQSEWYNRWHLNDLLDLTKLVSVNQLLHRDDFRKRYTSGNSITMTEMLYPLLQGYDSVAVHADIEFGGSDQMFNLLMGRELQKAVKQKQQLCITMPLLVGTDGVRKMSKSYDNYIALTEQPYDMYRKVMQIPDEQILPWMTLLTNVNDNLYSENTAPPMLHKKLLAKTLVENLHNNEEAHNAAEKWDIEVSKKAAATPTHFISLTSIAENGFAATLVNAEVITSKTNYKQLMQAGAIKLITDNKPIALAEMLEPIMKYKLNDVFQIGKHRYVKIVT